MTGRADPAESAQHHAVLAHPARTLPADRRPHPGPIAVLPNPKGVFVEAVQAAGGEVAELSPQTRGVVWLSSLQAAELTDLLERNPQVEWVQLPWAGVDAFADVLAHFAGKERPLWTSAKGAYSQPVAEHALALTLALLRVFPTRVRATSWSTVPEGVSLFGLNVVIIGAGSSSSSSSFGSSSRSTPTSPSCGAVLRRSRVLRKPSPPTDCMTCSQPPMSWSWRPRPRRIRITLLARRNSGP